MIANFNLFGALKYPARKNDPGQLQRCSRGNPRVTSSQRQVRDSINEWVDMGWFIDQAR